MTLGTHVVVGVAVAELFPSNPIIAFVAAFASHFLLDAIPHWDYKILSEYANPDRFYAASHPEIGVPSFLKPNKLFLLDLLRTGSDLIIGIIISLSIWQVLTFGNLQILILGAIGGALPDFMQFVYAHFPYQPIVFLQKFHRFMHAKNSLNTKPVIGVLSQVFVMICVIVIAKYLIQI